MMKNYEVTYLIRGQKHKTIIKADNKPNAIKILKTQQNCTVIKTEEIAESLGEKFERLKKYISAIQSSKVNIDALIVSIKQLAIMADAGIAFNTILSETVSSTGDQGIRYIFSKALDDINSGMTFSESFRNNFHGDFKKVIIPMIELGERTGDMASSMNKLADILEDVRENRTKIQKAIRYPAIIITVMVIAFVVLIMFVVPKFKAIFEKSGAELPMPPKIILFIEHLFSNYLHFVVLGIFGIIYLVRFLYRQNEKFKLSFDKNILKLYLVGKLSELAYISRFTLIFAELTKAGLPLSNSIYIASEIIENSYISGNLHGAVTSIERGFSLTQALRNSLIYDDIAIQMISAGENSGKLDEMLFKVRDYYNTRFLYVVDNISTYMEPILISLLSILLGFLALGVFMPMWDLASAVRK